MNKQENKKVEMGREEKSTTEIKQECTYVVDLGRQEINIAKSDLKTTSPFDVNVVLACIAYELQTINELTIKRRELIIEGNLETSIDDLKNLAWFDKRFRDVANELYDDLKQLEMLLMTTKYYEIYDAISPIMMATNYCLGNVKEVEIVPGF